MKHPHGGGVCVIGERALLAARIVAFILVVSAATAAEAAIVGHPVGALHHADFSSIENVRCCGWGPRGWYDTWRHCHYCGLGHPNRYCRFSVPRWRWFCPR